MNFLITKLILRDYRGCSGIPFFFVETSGFCVLDLEMLNSRLFLGKFGGVHNL